jgi:hypothetical protein
MKRSQHSELAKRINQAQTLLEQQKPHSDIVAQLIETYGVSQIQAYRYIRQARSNEDQVAIPENTVVFTVKLSPSLIARVKEFAILQKTSISKVVRAALEEFLAKKAHGQKGETS